MPVAAQVNAVTIPATALTDQFLDGDSFMYSCNGALLPNAPQINTCTDTGAALATWSVAATAALPTCSKCCDVISFEGFLVIRHYCSYCLRFIQEIVTNQQILFYF